MRTPKSLLTPEFLAMVKGGVSTIVSSCDAALRPSIMRAVASTISPDGCTVTVYVARSQSRQLLQDVAATGRIAVVFSQPMSHRTVQVKARSARTRNAQAPDQAVLQRYLLAMQEEVLQVGFAEVFTQSMLAYRLEDVVAISFEPGEAYDQTPGPRAGTALGVGAEAT